MCTAYEVSARPIAKKGEKMVKRVRQLSYYCVSQSVRVCDLFNNYGLTPPPDARPGLSAPLCPLMRQDCLVYSEDSEPSNHYKGLTCVPTHIKDSQSNSGHRLTLRGRDGSILPSWCYRGHRKHNGLGCATR